ncbi:hypothetical protein FHG87_020256, partial [Trinorchestia longiramus]
MEVSKQYVRGLLLYDFKSDKSAAASSRRINGAFGNGTVSELHEIAVNVSVTATSTVKIHPSYMEKLKQKYASPQFIASRGNLSELRTELSISPPTVLTVCDVTSSSPAHIHSQSHSHTTVDIPNGTLPKNNATDLAQVGVSKQLMPLSLAARTVMCLAAALGALDVYRGLSSLSQSSLE